MSVHLYDIHPRSSVHNRITTTIIAPTPLVAANFIILGKVIDKLGRQYSRLKPMWCKLLCEEMAVSTYTNVKIFTDTIIFCTFVRFVQLDCYLPR